MYGGLVEVVEFGGQALGVAGRLRQEQLDGEGGVVEASGGVEARGDLEGDGFGVEAGDASERGQRGEAGALAGGDGAEASLDDAAVFAAQRDDVGDGAERGQVKPALGGRFDGGGGHQGVGEAPSESAGGEFGERMRGAPGGLLGVGGDQGGDLRQGGAGRVVVDDDEFEAEAVFGAAQGVERGDAAIGGDDQARAFGGEALELGAVQSVAVGAAVGDEPAAVDAELSSASWRMVVAVMPSTS